MNDVVSINILFGSTINQLYNDRDEKQFDDSYKEQSLLSIRSNPEYENCDISAEDVYDICLYFLQHWID